MPEFSENTTPKYSHQNDKLIVLGTDSNQTKFPNWICTARHQEMCVFCFAGYWGYLYAALSLSLSTCMPLSLSLSLLVCLSLSLSLLVCLSLSLSLSTCMPLSLSLPLLVCRSLSLSLYLYAALSLSLSTCMPRSLSLSLLVCCVFSGTCMPRFQWTVSLGV